MWESTELRLHDVTIGRLGCSTDNDGKVEITRVRRGSPLSVWKVKNICIFAFLLKFDTNSVLYTYTQRNCLRKTCVLTKIFTGFCLFVLFFVSFPFHLILLFLFGIRDHYFEFGSCPAKCQCGLRARNVTNSHLVEMREFVYNTFIIFTKTSQLRKTTLCEVRMHYHMWFYL